MKKAIILGFPFLLLVLPLTSTFSHKQKDIYPHASAVDLAGVLSKHLFFSKAHNCVKSIRNPQGVLLDRHCIQMQSIHVTYL